jgi:hypothetical protein
MLEVASGCMQVPDFHESVGAMKSWGRPLNSRPVCFVHVNSANSIPELVYDRRRSHALKPVQL